MIYLIVAVFLLTGLALIVFGARLLRKPRHRERSTVRFRAPFTSFEFSGVGAGGIACILIGVGCLYLAWNAADRGGEDGQDTSSLSLVTVAVAQQNPSKTVKSRTEGWVYAPEGSFIGDDIKEAQRRAPLRDNHFDDLTGTILGKLLGYGKPDVVGQIKPGDCVRVGESTVVGFGKTWMHVKKVQCPKAGRVIQ